MDNRHKGRARQDADEEAGAGPPKKLHFREFQRASGACIDTTKRDDWMMVKRVKIRNSGENPIPFSMKEIEVQFDFSFTPNFAVETIGFHIPKSSSRLPRLFCEAVEKVVSKNYTLIIPMTMGAHQCQQKILNRETRFLHNSRTLLLLRRENWDTCRL